MTAQECVEQTSALEKSYGAVLAENEQLLKTQQTLNRELQEMKNTVAQLKKEQIAEKSSQLPLIKTKQDKGSSLFAKIRGESAKERAYAHKLKGEQQKFETELLEKSTLLAKAENTIKMQQVQMEGMKKEFRLVYEDGERLKDELNRSRWDAESAFNSNMIEKNKLMLQIANLTFQRDTADNKSKELSNKLVAVQQSYNEAVDAQGELKVERDQYCAQLMAAKRNYKELSGLYDEQNNQVNDQAQEHEKSICRFEEQIYQLSAENKKLSAEKAAHSSATQSKVKEEQEEEKNEEQQTGSKNLFHRMVGRYTMLLDKNQDYSNTLQGLKTSNAQLQKSYDRLQTEFTIKSTSYKTLTESHEKLQLKHKDQAAQLQQSEQEIRTLKSEVHSQKREYGELSRTLQDREYQLQFVLKNNQNRSLGPHARPNFASQLLSVTLQPASVAGYLEFKDIQGLQTLNSKLLAEKRLLKQQISDLSNRSDTANNATAPLETTGSSEVPSAQAELTVKASNETDIAGLPDASSQASIDKYKVKVDKLRKDVKELQCELTLSKEETTAAKKETNKKNVTVLQLKSTCEELEQKAASLEQSLNLTAAERARLKCVIDAAKEQEKDVKKQLSVLNSQSNRQLGEIDTLKKRLSQVQATYNGALENLLSAQNEIPELHAFIKREALLMKQKEEADTKAIQDLREELKETKAELGRTQSDFQILKTKANLYTSAADEDPHVKYMEALDNRVKLRVVTEKVDNQDKSIKKLEAEKKALMEKLDKAEETLNMHLIRKVQTSSSGTTTSVQSSVLASSQDTYMLDQENLQNNRDCATKSIKKSRNQNKVLKATQINSQHSIGSFEITLKAFQSEMAKLEQKNGSLSSQLSELKAKNGSLTSELDHSKEEVNVQTNKVVVLEENARVQEEELGTRQKEVQELQSVLQGLEKELADAKGCEASAKKYVEECKSTLETSDERWGVIIRGLTRYSDTGGVVESTVWSQKLEQVIQENYNKITQEVPPAGSEAAAATIESLQRLNNALANEKKDMEATITSKLEFMETIQKELIAEKSEFSSLVEKAAFLHDPSQAPLTMAKPDDELYQTELTAARKELETAQSNVTQLETANKEVKTELVDMVQKANRRGEVALELKKKYIGAKKTVEEKDKLIDEKEKQLARVEEESGLLKERHQGLHKRMKALELEKEEREKELKALKARPPDAKTSNKDAGKIKDFESQVAELKQSLSDSQIENNRLKASNSINTKRSKKLMEEITSMKAQLDAKVGDKRTREDEELEDEETPPPKKSNSS